MHALVPPPSDPLWRQRGQASLRRSTLRVLVPADGYHVQQEVVRSLRALGHDAVALDLRAPPDSSPSYALELLLSRVTSFAPDLLVSINYVGLDRRGIIDGILATLELPCAIWFIDHPLFFATGYLHQASPHTRLFAWDRSHARALERYGATPVAYLPLACEPQRFAEARARAADDALPSTFVGSSLVPLSATWRARLSETEATQAEEMAARLQADRTSLHALMPRPVPPIDRRTMILAYANCVGSRRHRRALLRALPKGELAVFGDEAWAQELPDAHAFAALAYGAQLGEVYRRSAINVNATILQMPEAVNQRVFDVPASGGFVLTDRQADTAELFVEGEEVVTYRDAAQLVERARYFAARPRERAQVAKRALARIEREHTYVHRLERLVAHMRQARP